MRRISALIILLILALASTAVVTAQDDNGEAEGMAYVRIAHFVPDEPDVVDVFVDGEISAVQGLGYSEVSDWYSVPAGAYSVSIAPEGEPLENAAIGPASIQVEAEGYYTVAAIGFAGNDTRTATVIEEDYSDQSFGETRITAFHAIPDAGPVTVLADGDPVFGLLAYPDTTQTEDGAPNDGYETVTLAEATLDVQIVDQADNSNVLLDIGEFEFTQQRHYFVAAIGTAASPSFRLVSTNVEDGAPQPENDIRTPANATASEGFVRVGHLSSGTPAVDVFIDGERSDIQGLDFASFTDFISLPVGTYEIAVAPEGEPIENAVLEFELQVEGGDYQTAVARGVLSNDTLEAQVIDEDYSPVDEGLMRISMFNAYPALGPVDLIRDDGLEAIKFLAYPGEQGDNDGFTTVDLLAGVYDFNIVSSNDPNNVIAEIEGLNWDTDTNFFIAVINGEDSFVLESAPIPESDE